MYIKKEEEIQIIREGGKHLTRILKKCLNEIKPGVNTEYLENMVLEEMKKIGGRPAFKDYPMGNGLFFPSAFCASINNEIVHGPAIPGRILKAGDIVGMDIGMEWPYNNTGELDGKKIPVNPYSKGGGYYTDMSRTVAVGKVSAEARKLMKTTQKCLEAGIRAAQPGNTLNDIGTAIERIADREGYGVVRDMVGHGVGYKAHEAPDVFHYAIGEKSRYNMVLKPGMVIAIEPMINAGTWEISYSDENDFSVVTADGSLSAHFENTIVITEDGPVILTSL